MMPVQPPTYKPFKAKGKRHQVSHRKERGIGYGTTAWQNIRMQVFALSDGVCAACGGLLDGVFHVDHIDADPLNNTLDNLQALHPGCHSAKTLAERQG